MRNRSILFAAGLLMTMAAVPAFAQSRPLATEDPEVVGPGQLLFEAGIDYGQDMFYPASGLRGALSNERT